MSLNERMWEKNVMNKGKSIYLFSFLILILKASLIIKADRKIH